MFTVPAGIEDGLTVMVWQLMTSVKLRLPVHPLTSIAVMVIGKLPGCVGMPESVALLSVNPLGKVPVTENVYGALAPLAVKVSL